MAERRPTDEELMLAYQGGSKEAFEELSARYRTRLFNYFRRSLGDSAQADDLLQTLVLRVHRARDMYRPSAAFSTWIYTIAHHVAIDHRRKGGQMREDLSSASDLDTALLDRFSCSDYGDPEASAIRGEIDRLVHDGLAQLPDKCRLPLVYAAIDGLDYVTIAAMLGVPTGTVKTLVFRGKQMLRRHIVAALEARAAGRKVSDAV
jgi:RNA polymerase sigma-70 factor (ECF subfamily)